MEQQAQVHYLNRHQVPLLTTNPLHVVFKVTRTLGDLVPTYYDWILTNSTVTASPRVDLDPDNMYAIDYFTFSADIEGSDYSAAIIDSSSAPGSTPGIPRFHLYVDSEKGGPLLTQPIPLPQFYQNADFPKWRKYSKSRTQAGGSAGGRPIIGVQGIKTTNQFSGAFEARLQQTLALAGKQSITLIFAFGLLEIKDEKFNEKYRKPSETLQPGGFLKGQKI